MSRNQIIIGLAILALIVIGVVVLSHKEAAPADTDTTTATTTPVTTTDPTSGWLIYSNSGNGVNFKYPASVSTSYVTSVDWPPKAQVVPSSTFTCTEAGSATARAGKTETRTINGHPYCVTEVTEGAAGSAYTQYAYASKRGGGNTIILTFSLRRVQCGNYEDPQKSACTEDQAAYNIDTLMDTIFSTASFSNVQ